MSIQRYTNRTTPDGVWLDKADDGEWALYADHLTELTAERERADRAELYLKRETVFLQGAISDNDALRERVARLVEVIKKASHGDYCLGDNFLMADGKRHNACTCWKRTALGVK